MAIEVKQGKNPMKQSCRQKAGTNKNENLPFVPLLQRGKEGDFRAKARNYVLRLIKFRERSEKEIRDKLKKKNYEARVIDEVIAHFKEIKIIADEEFAKDWIDSRIKKPLSLEVIRLELIQKGVDRKIIEKCINEKKSAFNESKALPELISSRLKKLKDKEEYGKIKPKLSAYFIRRGFSASAVYEAIDKLLPR